MPLIRLCLATLVLALNLAPGAAAQASLDPDKRAAIERLLVLTHATSTAAQVAPAFMTQIVQSIKSLRPDVPQKALDALPEELHAVIQEHLGAFTELMVQLYHKHYSADDIAQLTQFYGSEIGKKMIATQPALAKDSLAAGFQWGQMLNPELQRRVRARLAREGVNL